MEYRLSFVQNDDESADLNTQRLLRETFNMNFNLFGEVGAHAIARVSSTKTPFTRTDISIAKLAFERAHEHRRQDWFDVRERIDRLKETNDPVKVAGVGLDESTLNAFVEMYHQQADRLQECYQTLRAMEQVAKQMEKAVKGLGILDENLTMAEQDRNDRAKLVIEEPVAG